AAGVATSGGREGLGIGARGGGQTSATGRQPSDRAGAAVGSSAGRAAADRRYCGDASFPGSDRGRRLGGGNTDRASNRGTGDDSGGNGQASRRDAFAGGDAGSPCRAFRLKPNNRRGSAGGPERSHDAGRRRARL